MLRIYVLLIFIISFQIGSYSQTIGGKTLSKDWKKIEYGYNPDSIQIDNLYYIHGDGMFMCSNKGLYQYIDSIYRFKKIDVSPNLKNARVSMVMKHLGYYYTGFRDGYGLFRSKDLKKWEPLGSGKLGTSKIFYLYSMDSMLFVCNWQKTIYLSHNLGKSFRSISVGFNPLGKSFINNIENSEDYMFCSMNGDGVYSLNIKKGTAWEHSDKGLPESKKIGDLADIGKVLFLATDNGVYKSDNKGSSWKPVNAGMEGKTITRLVAEGSILYAATNQGELFFSEDFGTTWTKIPIDFMQSPISGVCVTDKSVFVAVNGTDAKPSYVYYLPFLKKGK
ncbi:hypothetical protein [Cytophaga aurantiaca]|uniref:hypothetical protein n=1 Tax=Cytophaga aurantiaca TaxID=29530 RepID=UPI0006877FEA|nr:hypothetical protein [Cytophaga aurantiaca]